MFALRMYVYFQCLEQDVLRTRRTDSDFAVSLMSARMTLRNSCSHCRYQSW